MDESQVPLRIILAELLRIQRWAGGEGVSAGRIFGLMHGIESVIRQENESFGIDEETQRKVENLLEDVDHDKQSSDGTAIKDRFQRDGVDEADAATIMELCRLQGRFGPAIDKIVKGKGSTFSRLDQLRSPEQDWFGSLHYMELIDCTEDVHKEMHAVYAPAVPRVGEIVTPQKGAPMRVIGVDHVVTDQGRQQGLSQQLLVPHVFLVENDADES